MSKRLFTYKPTALLGAEDNEYIRYLIGGRCDSLATTVIQIYETEDPFHNEWIKVETGVLCFIRDHNVKSYFFRLYQLQCDFLIWEHEMYKNFQFIQVKPFLHTFEGTYGQVAFNYTNIKEANEFYKTVNDRISARSKGNRPVQIQAQTISSLHRSATFSSNQQPLSPFQQTSIVLKSPQSSTKKKGESKINKADISSPTGFQHVGHVGWNHETGFDLKIDDPDIKTLFQQAGLTTKQLEDPSIKKVVTSFIQNHGGIEEVKNQYRASYDGLQDHYTPPQRSQPLSYATINRNVSSNYGNDRGPPIVTNQFLPRVPSKIFRQPPYIHNSKRAPPLPPLPREPSPPSRTVIPPPPPPSLPYSIPSPPTISYSSSSPYVLSNMSHYTPPPPLPPPQSYLLHSDVTTPINERYYNEEPDERSALLESIRNNGIHTLKKIREPKSDDSYQDNNGDGERGNFLIEIHRGIQLKPVKEDTARPKPNDLASVLAKAIANRHNAIQSEEEESSNDEDWDD